MDVCSQEETQLSRVTLSVGRHPSNLSALPFLFFALHCTRPRLLKGRWPSNACQCTMHVCKNIFGIKQRKQSCSIINNNLDGKPGKQCKWWASILKQILGNVSGLQNEALWPDEGERRSWRSDECETPALGRWRIGFSVARRKLPHFTVVPRPGKR